MFADLLVGRPHLPLIMTGHCPRLRIASKKVNFFCTSLILFPERRLFLAKPDSFAIRIHSAALTGNFVLLEQKQNI